MKTQSTDWNQLSIDHEIAYLRGDLATSSPESYTLNEMREISEAMDASTAEVEAAMKADFDSMPPRHKDECSNCCRKPTRTTTAFGWNCSFEGHAGGSKAISIRE